MELAIDGDETPRHLRNIRRSLDRVRLAGVGFKNLKCAQRLGSHVMICFHILGKRAAFILTMLAEEIVRWTVQA